MLQLLLHAGVECRMTLHPGGSTNPRTPTPNPNPNPTATVSGGGAKLERWRHAVNAAAGTLRLGEPGSLEVLFTESVTKFAEMRDAMQDDDTDDDDDDDESGSVYGAGSGSDVDGSDDSDGEVIDDDAFFTTDWEVEIARNKVRS